MRLAHAHASVEAWLVENVILIGNIRMPSLPDWRGQEFAATDDYGQLHAFKWNGRVTSNDNGRTGWVDDLGNGTQNKIHLCAHSPCRARWTSTKHGYYVAPEHMQMCSPSADPIDPLAASAASAAVAANASTGIAPTASASAAVAAGCLDDVPPCPSPCGAVAAGGAPIDDAPIAPVTEEVCPPIAPVIEEVCTPIAPVIEEVCPPDGASDGDGIINGAAEDGEAKLYTVELDLSAVADTGPVPALPQKAALRIPVAAPPTCLPDIAMPVVAKAADAPMHNRCHTDRVLMTVMQLAREIRTEGQYVGYSFFVVLGLLKNARPFSWEGGERIDLIDTFASWVLDDSTRCVNQCCADAVACCISADPGCIISADSDQLLRAGTCTFHHVSADHPLNECRHWVAGHHSSNLAGAAHEATGMQAFYNTCNVALLGTVIDGNCGPDTACIMFGLPQSRESRNTLRREAADFIRERCEEPWLQDLLVVTQELDFQMVDDARQEVCGHMGIAMSTMPDERSESTTPGDKPALVAAIADTTEPSPVVCTTPEAMAAIKWATKISDMSVVRSVCGQLPEWSLLEQLALYRNRDQDSAAVAAESRAMTLMVRPGYASDRHKACVAFKKWKRDKGIAPEGDVPQGSIEAFLSERIVWAQSVKRPARTMAQWFRRWQRSNHASGTTSIIRRKLKSRNRVPATMRRRPEGQGRHFAAPIVRQGLFEWFVRMRFNVDWRALRNQVSASQGTPQSRGSVCKAICRFTRNHIKAKCQQLIGEYVRACLETGSVVHAFTPDRQWYDRWLDEYGLCERAPNRQYKVAREVLYKRLEVGWLNQAKIRQLCICAHGYDPEMENWDQSPFHPNEGGSQKAKTIAIAGSSTVPIIENPNVTHQRWTLNVTTFSDKARILAGERPYAELMFKFDGDVVKRRLQEYVRSRGYPSWLSVTTSPSGSYREHHIMEFLERHLPLKDDNSGVGPQSRPRQWRIIMADDYGPHKSIGVWNLCWSRGYVMLPHGGGVTPVVQTPDTDLNQHIRREYTELECGELINQLRMGAKIPQLAAERSIDIMLRLLSPARLHLAAAEGYTKTGARVPLDGSQDHEVTREAGEAWRALHMRQKIAVAVEMVKSEYNAGRLKWCLRDVNRLITPYSSNACDKVLEAQGDLAGLMAERAGDESSGEDSASEGGSLSDGEACVDGADKNATAQPQSRQQQQPSEAVHDETAIAEMLSSSKAITVYKDCLNVLRDTGLVTAAVNLENIMHREERRQRLLQREDPAVAEVFSRQRDIEYDEEIKQKLLMDTATAAHKALADCRRKTEEANALLKKRKADLFNTEKLLEAHSFVWNVSLTSLGQGKKNSGGVNARKARHQVLDRLSRLGTGISASQSNDFPWFKEAWDDKMMQEHDIHWGGEFAQVMQKIVTDIEQGIVNAFSMFVHNETRRSLQLEPLLSLPGIGKT